MHAPKKERLCNRQPSQKQEKRVDLLRISSRLVPALGGGPGCILRPHFSCRRLAVDRVFNAAKHGKTRKSPADRTLSHRISGMNRRIEESEQIPHTRTPFRSVVFARFLENSIHNMCLLGTKFREKNDDAGRNFALIGGGFGGGYESETQQSPKQTFSCMSQACISAILGRLGDCGSLGITSYSRPFFAYSNTG